MAELSEFRTMLASELMQYRDGSGNPLLEMLLTQHQNIGAAMACERLLNELNNVISAAQAEKEAKPPKGKKTNARRTKPGS